MQLVDKMHQSPSELLPTALFVIEQGLESFDDYWQWFEISNHALSRSSMSGQNLEGIFQFASFHPRYLFAGEAEEDDSHFSNRSPFPMVHVLREADVEAALNTIAHPERIPERNQKHMRRLGRAGILAAMPELADTQVFVSSSAHHD